MSLSAPVCVSFWASAESPLIARATSDQFKRKTQWEVRCLRSEPYLQNESLVMIEEELESSDKRTNKEKDSSRRDQKARS